MTKNNTDLRGISILDLKLILNSAKKARINYYSILLKYHQLERFLISNFSIFDGVISCVEYSTRVNRNKSKISNTN